MNRPPVEDEVNRNPNGADAGSSSSLYDEASSNYTDSYEHKLNQMYINQMHDYDTSTKPIIDQLEDEAQSTSIVDESRRMSGQLGEKTAAITERQLGYGMGGTLASRRSSIGSQQAHDVSKARNAVMTQAHSDQRNQQQAARTELMSIAEQLQTSGTASMSQAYAAKNQRDQAYKSAKKGFMSQAGSVVGGVIGGIYGGGPAGAAAGSAVGGAAGGAIGG